ncbi:MAG: Dual specificity phosphatase, catalytic domain [Synergistetes bacterium ADurb.BinA166]|nr:MAG: Dual specificity phosphatase, catalytic domain [Synergistetes bacterium ADurb.BinA166]
MGVFDPARVALVDAVDGNYLIRGPVPIRSDGSFAYSEISSAAGVDVSAGPLVVVSLIDCTGEHRMLADELAAFGLPDQWGISYWPPYLQPGYDSKKLWGSCLSEHGVHRPASLIWWPIEGLADGQDPEDFLGWPGWNFSGLVDCMAGLLGSRSNVSLYVHCSLGADRTGAAVSGYLMKSKGLTADEALSEASIQTPAGSPSPDYVRLVRAYAASL